MRKFAMMLALLIFAGVQVVLAQTTITGTVSSSEDSKGIPGATVLVKGTNVGLTTDMSGKYSIKVPVQGKILQFSFVGMKAKEVPIGNQTVINVVLDPDVMNIEGVVVTALGISREKKSLGYAAQDVSGADIGRANNANFMTAISGKIAGVEVRQSSGMPGSPATILIRGARSFSGNNSPLYVVDGMPISTDVDYAQNVTGAFSANRALDINPSDIESINVLKGQAAAALYGIRASNGVIVITTKSGKGAVKNGKLGPVVNFSTNFSTDVAARLPEVQQTYAQGYYAGGVNNASDNTFYPAFSYSWGPKISDLPNDPTYGGNNYDNPGKFFDPYKGAWVNPTAYNNAENFYKETGQTWNNNIDVSQAGEFGNFMVGFGNTHQVGIVPEIKMDRYNAKAAATINLNAKWKAGFSGNYSDVKLNKMPSGNDSWLFTVYGAPASYDLMGTPYHQEGTNGAYRQISYRRGAVGENPRWALNNNHFDEGTRRFFGNTYLDYNPVSWVNVHYQLGVDTYATNQEDYYEMGSARNGQSFPTAARYPTPDNPVYAYIAPTGGSINNYGISRSTINSVLNISFKKKITENLNAILIVGNEINDSRARSWTMTGTGFTTPGWNNMANTSTQTAGETKYADRTVGFYGNLAMDYKSMLYLNLTGRNDVVSSMPNGSRSFFYPSASLGFVFTEVAGLSENKILPFGKIRASYAQVGQAGTYKPKTYLVGGAASGFLNDGILFPLGGISGYGPNTSLYDPALVPENTKSFELGLELKFLNNRIGIDYTYSDQESSDQIFPVPLAGSTGAAELYMNAGQMTSKGHEIVLYIIPVKTKDFAWNLNLNFTKIKNECIELAPGVESISLGGYETPNIRASAGDTYPAIYGNQFARDEQGRILVDEDPDSYYYGMPMLGEFGKIGDVSPNFYLSVNNAFTYKFITLTAQLDWKDGGQMYSGSNRLMDLYGSSARTEDRTTPFIYDGYKADGTKNDIQRGGPDDIWAYPDLYNDVLASLDEAQVYETSFVKLREVALTISLPSKIISKAHIQALSVSLFARNFLLWTTLPNFDPESSQGQGNMQGGMDYMSLPQAKSYGIGLNLTF
ncbi:MAG: SusC/RagA family TonB-linked outer membrane protein [Bacteroidales bacterium]|nr:SusC/RagA family TonB-linked outer membrane protein [Bacteroidales bacterium]MBK9356666.1 SusC/RagA family TonB-linked outer membrane protein [Bacteroidales bacterium]